MQLKGAILLALVGACGGEPLRDFLNKDAGALSDTGPQPDALDIDARMLDAFQCGYATTVAPDITAVVDDGAVPDPGEGMIVEGTYHLTAIHDYGETDGVSLRQTLVLGPDTFEIAARNAGSSVDTHVRGSQTLVGVVDAQLQLTAECGASPQPKLYQYTASSTELSLFEQRGYTRRYVYALVEP